eukprot:2224273-Pleurochrysis_carterae.AAC.2
METWSKSRTRVAREHQASWTRRQQEDSHVTNAVTQDPPFPVHTISIEHKTVTAPQAMGHQHILVVVDMLTRFIVTAILTETVSAEETLSALIKHVFSFPLVIELDNGTAFQNEPRHPIPLPELENPRVLKVLAKTGHDFVDS